jgi:20S proteasome alpha/beta subunit
MTLALAIRASDGLVMASDSRMTGGRGSADISEKFLQVNRDVGVMTYGLASPGNSGIRALADEVKTHPGKYTTMSSIVSRAQELFSKEFWQFLSDNRMPDGSLRPELQNELVGFVIGGFDGNETGQFLVYQLESPDLFHPSQQEQVIAAQWPVATMLFPLLEYPAMSISAALDLGTLLMLVTAAVEPTVGGPIHIATVNLSEGFSLLHDREVSKLVNGNQDRLLRMKRAWMMGWAHPCPDPE